MRTLTGLYAMLLVLAATAPAFAQSTKDVTPSAKDAIRETLDTLFDGMREGDSTKVRSVFYAGAVMARAQDTGMAPRPIDSFVRAVGSPHEVVWDERIWDVTIHVDQRLATVWMEYAFFLGEDLHHCGVNSMMFYHADDGWKITYLADTDRGTDCDIPPEHQ